MKSWNLSFIGLALAISLLCSYILRNYELQSLEDQGKIPFGPLPAKEIEHYSFESIEKAFNSKIELSKINSMSKRDFEKIIYQSVDDLHQDNVKKYLKFALEASEEYQVDPFWILSIMMVESKFNHTVTSTKNAQGIMQIKPETAVHLNQLMAKNSSGKKKDLYSPEVNIQIGVFYLKKLLQNFRLNYNLATIAYNIGPNKLKNRLDEEDIDTDNFSYLLKIKEEYRNLTKKYVYYVANIANGNQFAYAPSLNTSEIAKNN